MNITKDIVADTLKIVVTDRIDTVTAPQFQNAVLPLPDGVKSLDIDLKDVVYVSSAGLRAFAMLSMTVQSAGGKMELRNLQSEVRTVFDMTGFSAMLGLA